MVPDGFGVLQTRSENLMAYNLILTCSDLLHTLKILKFTNYIKDWLTGRWACRAVFLCRSKRALRTVPHLEHRIQPVLMLLQQLLHVFIVGAGASSKKVEG